MQEAGFLAGTGNSGDVYYDPRSTVLGNPGTLWTHKAERAVNGFQHRDPQGNLVAWILGNQDQQIITTWYLRMLGYADTLIDMSDREIKTKDRAIADLTKTIQDFVNKSIPDQADVTTQEAHQRANEAISKLVVAQARADSLSNLLREQREQYENDARLAKQMNLTEVAAKEELLTAQRDLNQQLNNELQRLNKEYGLAQGGDVAQIKINEAQARQITRYEELLAENGAKISELLDVKHKIVYVESQKDEMEEKLTEAQIKIAELQGDLSRFAQVAEDNKQSKEEFERQLNSVTKIKEEMAQGIQQADGSFQKTRESQELRIAAAEFENDALKGKLALLEVQLGVAKEEFDVQKQINEQQVQQMKDEKARMEILTEEAMDEGERKVKQYNELLEKHSKYVNLKNKYDLTKAKLSDCKEELARVKAASFSNQLVMSQIQGVDTRIDDFTSFMAANTDEVKQFKRAKTALAFQKMGVPYEEQRKYEEPKK